MKRWNLPPPGDRRKRIDSVPDARIFSVIERIPTEFASERAREFAYQVIETSKLELLRGIR